MDESVTVVIPTYNRSKLMLRAVMSAARQTLPPSEILIVDDGSADETAELAERLITEAPTLFGGALRIRYLRQANLGANAARNHGIREATTRYVAFLDSDDLWHPNKLELQMAAISAARQASGEPVLSFTGRLRVDGNLKVLARQSPGEVRNKNALQFVNLIGTLSSVIVDRWLLAHVEGFDETLMACQDWDLFQRVLPYVQIVGAPDPLVLYVDADIDRITNNRRRRILSHIKIYKRYMKGRVDPSDYDKLYLNLAEDLAILGRRKLAARFYAAALERRARGKWFAGFLANRNWNRITEDRYRKYRSTLLRSERKDPEVRATNTKYVEDYAKLIEEADRWTASASTQPLSGPGNGGTGAPTSSVSRPAYSA